MSISIQTNIASMMAQENLRVNNDFQTTTVERLSSGFRINMSGDDAAGLAVANGLRSSEAELTQGVRNANDGISQLQIVDGGMNNISHILDRLKTLATQSASDTFTGSRTTLDNEFQDLLTEIDRQAGNIGLAGGGAMLKSLSIYVGGGSGATVTVDLSTSRVDTNALGLALAGKSVDTAANATTAIAAVASAVTKLGDAQGAVGSGENKLGFAVGLAHSQITSFSAAESRIRDADVAAEAANLTKAQVLQQSSLAAMAQANSAPQSLLKLLQ